MNMKHKTRTTLCTLTMLSALSACTSISQKMPSNDELLAEITEQDGRACVRSGDIRGYGTLDDDVISVDTRIRNEYFLFTTVYRCHSLESSFQLGFDSRFFEMCGGGGDSIVTSDDKCPIKSIYQFESREAAFSAFDELKARREALRKELGSESSETKDT